MNVRARDLWTGDLIVKQGKIVTKLQRVADGDVVKVTMADVIVVPNGYPLEIRNEIELSYRGVEVIAVVRDRPLKNGMHMTQFDGDGLCHGRANPELERDLRVKGKLAKDFVRQS